jgi:hypothetical protein
MPQQAGTYRDLSNNPRVEVHAGYIGIEVGGADVVQRDDGMWSLGWDDEAPGPFETRAFRGRQAPPASVMIATKNKRGTIYGVAIVIRGNGMAFVDQQHHPKSPVRNSAPKQNAPGDPRAL